MPVPECPVLLLNPFQFMPGLPLGSHSCVVTNMDLLPPVHPQQSQAVAFMGFCVC